VWKSQSNILKFGKALCNLWKAATSNFYFVFSIYLSYLEALNANQPHQSIKRPTRALVGLPIGGDPSISHLPNLGPSIQAAINALDPPTTWTGPDPEIKVKLVYSE
jgi:hypothetical protein